MLKQADVKFIHSLRLKKYRYKHHAFVAEGDKLVTELLTATDADGGVHIMRLFATKEWITTRYAILNQQRALSCEVIAITSNELKKISLLTTPAPVVAVVQMPNHSPDVVNWHKQLTLAVDGLQDPGNLGTILRIADWYGITDVVCSEDCVDVYNPKVIQATMGAIARVRVHEMQLKHFFTEYCRWGNKELPVYGAMLEGTNLHTAQLHNRAVILIGSEGAGIRKPLHRFITYRITIPRFGKAESLNVAVAAGIICDHFRKASSVLQ